MKYCSRCKLTKSLSEFGNNRSTKDGKQRWCKKCDRDNKHKWFTKNKEVQLARVKRNTDKSVQRNQDYIFEYLLNHPCVDCGETDILCLDFDHDDIEQIKRGNVSEMLRRCSINTLEIEINKCKVRCSNCHRKITAKRGNYAKYRWLVQRSEQ